MGDNFTPTLYARSMAAMLAVPDSVLEENAAAIEACASELEVNKIICKDIAAAKPEVTLEQEMLDLFSTLTKNVHSGKIESLQNDISRNIDFANRMHRDALGAMRETARKREEISKLTGVSMDLTPEIKKIVADGWFTLEPQKTRELNAASTTNNHGIYFSTQDVFLTHKKPTANIDITVPMGKYLIKYMPQDANLYVMEYKDNVKVSSYIHPHVASDGSVCWGTGHDKTMLALANQQPSIAFNILRMVLTSYNDDSPYASLGEFWEAIDPRNRYHFNTTFKLYGERCVWLRTTYLPVDIDPKLIVETAVEGDRVGGQYILHSRKLVRVFRLLDDEGDRAPRSPYFVQLSNGRFWAIADRHIMEWASTSDTKKEVPNRPAQSMYSEATYTVDTTIPLAQNVCAIQHAEEINIANEDNSGEVNF